jgi:hypothetical protein
MSRKKRYWGKTKVNSWIFLIIIIFTGISLAYNEGKKIKNQSCRKTKQ